MTKKDKDKQEPKPAPEPIMPLCPNCKKPAVHCTCTDNVLKK